MGLSSLPSKFSAQSLSSPRLTPLLPAGHCCSFSTSLKLQGPRMPYPAAHRINNVQQLIKASRARHDIAYNHLIDHRQRTRSSNEHFPKLRRRSSHFRALLRAPHRLGSLRRSGERMTASWKANITHADPHSTDLNIHRFVEGSRPWPAITSHKHTNG
jgi:hypothetical protein